MAWINFPVDDTQNQNCLAAQLNEIVEGIQERTDPSVLSGNFPISISSNLRPYEINLVRQTIVGLTRETGDTTPGTYALAGSTPYTKAGLFGAAGVGNGLDWTRVPGTTYGSLQTGDDIYQEHIVELYNCINLMDRMRKYRSGINAVGGDETSNDQDTTENNFSFDISASDSHPLEWCTTASRIAGVPVTFNYRLEYWYWQMGFGNCKGFQPEDILYLECFATLRIVDSSLHHPDENQVLNYVSVANGTALNQPWDGGYSEIGSFSGLTSSNQLLQTSLDHSFWPAADGPIALSLIYDPKIVWGVPSIAFPIVRNCTWGVKGPSPNLECYIDYQMLWDKTDI